MQPRVPESSTLKFVLKPGIVVKDNDKRLRFRMPIGAFSELFTAAFGARFGGVAIAGFSGTTRREFLTGRPKTLCASRGVVAAASSSAVNAAVSVGFLPSRFALYSAIFRGQLSASASIQRDVLYGVPFSRAQRTKYCVLPACLRLCSMNNTLRTRACDALADGG